MLSCKLQNMLPNWLFQIVIAGIVLLSLANYAFALPRDAELVLDDIWLDNQYPQPGDTISISGRLHNAGIKPTESFSSFIQIGYIIDGKLLKIENLKSVKAGLSEQIEIKSGPLIIALPGTHEMRVVADYSDTLNDDVDNPKDNELKKTFTVKPKTKTQLSINTTQEYFTAGKSISITITGHLTTMSNQPLKYQAVTMKINDFNRDLTTDDTGSFSTIVRKKFYSNAVINADFNGTAVYDMSSSQKTIYALPKTSNTGILLKIVNNTNTYDFDRLSYSVVVFQNSYDVVFKKIDIRPSDLLDSKAIWVSLPSKNSYFEEIYANGRLVFVTNKKHVDDNSIVVDNLSYPTANLRFHVKDAKNNPVSNVVIKTWIYSTVSGKDGFTDWIQVLPATSKNDPYLPQVIFADGSTTVSEPFLILPEEKRVIEIMIDDSLVHGMSSLKDSLGKNPLSQSGIDKILSYVIENKIVNSKYNVEQLKQKIPYWFLKNNINLWLQNKITDRDFILGLQNYAK